MAKVLFLTANDPARKDYWNAKLIDGLINAGVDIKFASWQGLEAELLDLATSSTHICLITAAHYNYSIGSFVRLLTETLPEVQQRVPAVRVLNSAELVLWNSNKTYLIDLQDAGFEMPQTALASQRQSLAQLIIMLQSFSQSTGSKAIVVKPSVGASGLDVMMIDDAESLSDDESAKLTRLLDAVTEHEQLVLQEFVADIKVNGELSLVYIDGVFVTAVLKSVAKGHTDEFRINPAYGGVAHRITDDKIPQSAIATAGLILGWLSARFGPDACAYMRLDGVIRTTDGAFLLMEVECVEPGLLTSDDELCEELVRLFKGLFSKV